MRLCQGRDGQKSRPSRPVAPIPGREEEEEDRRRPFQLSFPAAVPPLSQRPAVPLCSERGGGQVVEASKVGEIFTSQAATNFCVTPGRASHSRGAKLDWWQVPRSSYNMASSRYDIARQMKLWNYMKHATE